MSAKITKEQFELYDKFVEAMKAQKSPPSRYDSMDDWLAGAKELNRRTQAERLKLKPLNITLQEFEKLSEYSCTLPTGTTPGKRWKREQGSHDRTFYLLGGKSYWMIGEYEAIPSDDTQVKINWYRPVFKVPALKPPEPVKMVQNDRLYNYRAML